MSIEAGPSRRAVSTGREALGRTASWIEVAPSRRAASTGREMPLTASGEDMPADREQTRTRARQQQRVVKRIKARRQRQDVMNQEGVGEL